MWTGAGRVRRGPATESILHTLRRSAPDMNETPTRALTAEAIGTFALCFIGILAINVDAISGGDGAASLATIALAHGLAIMVMVAALGAISGGHFNPAVTAGLK